MILDQQQRILIKHQQNIQLQMVAKQQKHIRRTAIQDRNGVGQQLEQSEVIDDNLLPEPEIIEKYQRLDPEIFQWLKCRAEKEQEFRHEFNRGRMKNFSQGARGIRIFNICALIFCFCFLTFGSFLSYYLLSNGQITTGTIFSGVYFIAGATLLIPVSYTHLTLPTICSVQISVVAVLLKKKKRK
eukprot:TRINITY_DN18115_c0_g1_i1.p1 TRINITY_DN18115_c0_g1~~TRINITY_DN18115_c0_g1_i1.p1  ORF type:complete len:185 (-),score=7.35 TRINITY_DN18115_c0_g1_i1:99-653(-)